MLTARHSWIVSLISIALLQGCGGGGRSTGNDQNTGTVPDEGTATPSPENATPQTEPYYQYSWYFNAANSILESKGYSINPNADIHIEEAWNITKGNGVKIAVIDEGFVVDHEDLAANVIGTTMPIQAVMM